MSLDRSLKSANALVRHRNVLTRAEKLERLKEEEKWTDAKSVFGLPKVANRKQEAAGKPAKEEAAEAVAGAEGVAAPAAGAAPAAAAGAKAPAAGKAPAAAAKPAAGAAKAPAAPAGKKK
jgi:small basic protein (TIGR04137 family)